MKLRVLIDMNLSPSWIDELCRHGYDATHWSTVGDAVAKDAEVMHWARTNRQVVFTHDLDFGTILALTHARGPSVIQVRGANVLPENIGDIVVGALRQYNDELLTGALLVIEINRLRVRVLPL